MVFDHQRYVVGFIIVLVFFVTFIFNFDFLLLILLLFFVAYEIFSLRSISIINYLFIFIILANLILFYLYFDQILILLSSLILLLIFSFIFRKYFNFFFILIVFLSFLLTFILNTENRILFYSLILLSFINDTSAYIIGTTFKGPKISPIISPNKTWSGTIISFVLSACLLFFLKFDVFDSIIVSISFFYSDLYFSYFKRKNNIKDFSNILFKHGGILDRLDSILLPSSLLLLLTM